MKNQKKGALVLNRQRTEPYARDLLRVRSEQARTKAELEARLRESELLQHQLMAYAEDLTEMYKRMQTTYLSTLQALAIAVESRDEETGGHSRRVTDYSLAIAEEMRLGPGDTRAISYGAPLHDIGKIATPDAILLKPGPLTDDEWAVIRRHPELGYQILNRIEFLKDALPIVLQHHEHYDGRGYPCGLRGYEIDIGARVFAVADALDAMTSNRYYRQAQSFECARDEIVRNRGSQFDPVVVDAFLASYDRLRVMRTKQFS